jgi:prepilin-type processing-associated H-X9-DG protein
VQAKLLPFVEQLALGEGVREAIASGDGYSTKTINGKKICNYRIETLMCPSEIKDEPRGSDYYPLNVAINMGTGTILGSSNSATGDGAFGVNFKGQPAQFTDGLSKTLAMAEVRGWTPYTRDGQDLNAVPVGTDAAALQSLSAGSYKADSGHTEWCDGRTHQAGFTTGFTPNTVTPVSGGPDGDYTSFREGGNRTGPCIAVVTSRSYHSGGLVNAAMMDGSVRSFTKDVGLTLWRALSTRAGGEVVSVE